MLENILDSTFFNLFVLTAILTLSGLVIWIMYIHLSKKDLFKISKPKKENSKWRIFVCNFAYFAKYIIVFPLYSFIWFVIFSFILLLMSKSQDGENILLFGIVIISSIRACAYINERLAEDIAKLLPLTMIATIVMSSAFLTLDIKQIIASFWISGNSQIISLIPFFAKYLLFTIVLEWVLRIINIIYDRLKASKKRTFEVPSYKEFKDN